MGKDDIQFTSLVYIEKDGCYLMMHRTKKKNDENSGKWIGVGGHFEENEDAVSCMKREVFEECAVMPTDYKYRGVVTFISNEWGKEFMHLFTVKKWDGIFNLDCDEGELKFIKKDELFSLPMWEGDRIFLNLIASEHKFFNLTLEYNGEALEKATLDGKVIDAKQF